VPYTFAPKQSDMLNIKKLIIYGVFLGLVSVTYSVIMYTGGVERMSNFWMGMALLPLSMVFLFYFALRVRREDFGGFWNFRQAFIAVFVIHAVSGVVATLWGILQFTLIDPTLGEALAERIMERTSDWMEEMNAPEEAREKALADMASLPDRFTAVGQMLSYVKSLMWTAILSVIGGALLRKKDNSLTNVQPL